MTQPRVLVASAFEAEMQPLTCAYAAASLQAHGVEAVGWDAHFQPEAAPEGPFDLVLVSVQQFEGLEKGLSLARDVRERFGTTVMAFGQYAQMNHREFLGVADAIVMEEPELISEELAELARGTRELQAVPALMTSKGMRPRPPRRRISVSTPARDLFPSLVHYPAHHSPFGLMGNIEASRGCHHKCTYCSVYGAYDGGVAVYEADSVLSDALQLAEEGVRHFCFIDAEFFNSRTIGAGIVERLVDAVGPITFEFTTRVDHVLSYPRELEKLVSLGLRRVTCALEFPSDRILRIFDKHIDVDHMRQAVVEARRLGFELYPTFIPFTPWVEYDELLGFEDWLVEADLAHVTDPTALQTRLLLFKGSPLLSSPWMEDIATVDRGFWTEWTHPDRRVEELWQQRRSDAEDVGRVRCCVKC
ncbi:arsinothricin biosynthesis radical SAM protein ArsL [Streptomyces albidus (ex Kaewkla and Franco 2022)]|uniref:arsinothricin biosynthesis radical SAM protein ArsL n=1 Tax=Streptomyces albidus (ex Kaewkla and Franco 2022) TaxID=722709 RepID=UPI0015EE43A3|nr:RCCLKC-tail radical SAM protein [Streptomyces albidus (ex Kaewkla and Franco 2022)]